MPVQKGAPSPTDSLSNRESAINHAIREMLTATLRRFNGQYIVRSYYPDEIWIMTEDLLPQKSDVIVYVMIVDSALIVEKPKPRESRESYMDARIRWASYKIADPDCFIKTCSRVVEIIEEYEAGKR